LKTFDLYFVSKGGYVMNIERIAKEISKVVGPEKVLTGPDDLICYSYDTSSDA